MVVAVHSITARSSSSSERCLLVPSFRRSARAMGADQSRIRRPLQSLNETLGRRGRKRESTGAAADVTGAGAANEQQPQQSKPVRGADNAFGANRIGRTTTTTTAMG